MTENMFEKIIFLMNYKEKNLGSFNSTPVNFPQYFYHCDFAQNPTAVKQ